MTVRQLFLCLIILMVIPSRAHAYLDPGTGGLLYQIGFAFFSVAMGWLLFPFRAIKEAWRRRKNRSDVPVKTPDAEISE